MTLKSAKLIGTGLLAAWLGSAHAQAPIAASTAPALYVVTYYETVAAGQAMAAGASPTASPSVLLTRYRDSASREPGAISVEVLDDADRPSRYVVPEVWSSADAFARHRSAASTLQLNRDLGTWLTNPGDQRLHTRFE